MTRMVAIATMLVVVAISLIATRVAAVILVATGMSREAARFEARSAFTSTGFTTSQSESLIAHPLRRRVVMTLMLMGNAGVVAILGSLILGFTRRNDVGTSWMRIAELVGGLFLIAAAARSAWVDRHLTAVISRALRRWSELPHRDLGQLLGLAGGYAVSELAVNPGAWVAGRTLAELALRDEGVVVLGIRRAGGAYRGAPGGSTQVHVNDVLLVYGPRPQLAEIDHRRSGPDGDRQHLEAVAHQAQLRRARDAVDEAAARGEPAAARGEPAETSR